MTLREKIRGSIMIVVFIALQILFFVVVNHIWPLNTPMDEVRGGESFTEGLGILYILYLLATAQASLYIGYKLIRIQEQ